MNTRYSPTTKTFYPLDIDFGANLPPDVIEVSLDDYNAAMTRPAGCTFDFVNGKLIISVQKTRYSPATKAFYPISFDYGAGLPADVIEVSVDDFNAAMARPAGHAFDFDDVGQLIITAPPALTLDQVKAAKLAELATAFARRIDAIQAGYPDAEVKSWFKQESEAVAYTANNAAATPLLSGIAGERGITVADLAGRVIANASAYAVAGGAIIGKWQKYGDAVNAAADAAAVAAIVWTD